MAWTSKGADRGKSYQVYKDLESRYQEAAKERDDLIALLRVKDSTIRMLAAELANVPGSDMAHQDAVKATIEAVERLSELRARSVPHEEPARESRGPGIRSTVVARNVPLSEQLRSHGTSSEALKKTGGK